MENPTLTMDGNVKVGGHDGDSKTMNLEEFVVSVVQNDIEDGGPISRMLQARLGLNLDSAKDGE